MKLVRAVCRLCPTTSKTNERLETGRGLFIFFITPPSATVLNSKSPTIHMIEKYSGNYSNKFIK